MHKRFPIILLVVGFVLHETHATPWRTQALQPQIHTLQVQLSDNSLALPVIELHSDQQMRIAFDELSYDSHYFNYKIVHCNADWTPSALSEVEYIDGFYDGIINDYTLSTNTTTLYTHYQLLIPNDELRLKVSGNYAVLIAENNDFDNVAAVACFSVVDSRITVTGSVRNNTDIELANRYQQLDFELDTRGYEIRDPFNELKVTVRQNQRWDNAVSNLQPTYTSATTQAYKNNRQLIFEGGNQYRSIDFSSEYTYGAGIERIVFDHEYFNVLLTPSELRTGRGVAQGEDANGRYLVNRQQSDDSDSEADYMWVHFILPMDEPFFTGSVYLLGELCGNDISEQARMTYDFTEKAYIKSLLLKQGGYNFLYAYVPKNSTFGSLQPTEGSYWQTENEYTIYVYHRAWGERYDRLVAVKTIYSN
ncbi:MAG: DUF5103 domain-containing protein [Paludibacteraceae bacterium]